MRTVRFRARGDRLEPLEPVRLVEGSEVEVPVSVAETPTTGVQVKRVPRFRTWKMGVKEPLTREEIYEDV